MGFWDALFGRSKPVRPDLDQLFALPSAAVTLQAGAGFRPTGLGSVCFASVEGGAFTRLRREVRALLDADVRDARAADAGPGRRAASSVPGGASPAAERSEGGRPVEFSRDEFGYTWLLTRQPPDDPAALVNDLHAVNTLLEESGFGPQLLCSLVGFHDAGAGGTGGRSLALVYLYKRGTFYPFAPARGGARSGAQRRDNALELQVRGLLEGDLPIEKELNRWFPVWGAPGL